MKKIFIISASILVAFGIAACGSGKSENTTTEAIKETTFVSEKENTGKTESIESSAVSEKMEHKSDRYSVNEAVKLPQTFYANPEEFDVEPWLDIFEALGLTKEFPRPKANGTTEMCIAYNSSPLGPDPNTGEPREGVSYRSFYLFASPSYRQYREELYDYVCNQVVPFYDSKYTLVEDVTQDPDFEREYEEDYNTNFRWRKTYSDEEGNEYEIRFRRDSSVNGAGLKISYTAHK